MRSLRHSTEMICERISNESKLFIAFISLVFPVSSLVSFSSEVWPKNVVDEDLAQLAHTVIDRAMAKVSGFQERVHSK